MNNVIEILEASDGDLLDRIENSSLVPSVGERIYIKTSPYEVLSVSWDFHCKAYPQAKEHLKICISCEKEPE